MAHSLTRFAIAAAALCSASAHADTQFGEHVRLSGFGTVSAAVADTDEAQFRTDPRQGRGADKSVDFGTASKLGLQANVTFNDTFSAVAQVLSARRLEKSTALEWAYGEAKLPAGFSIKAGRMVTPTYLLSDSRAVGYSQHWAQTPNEIYNQFPPSSFDGGQLVYRASFGSFNVLSQLSAGSASADFLAQGIPLTTDFDRMRSLNVVVERGEWMLRLGTTRAKAKTFFGGALASETSDKFTGVGLQYDNGTALVMTEYALRRDEKGSGNSDSWYVSGGWRFGSFLPYLTVAKMTPKGYAYARSMIDNTTQAVGVRWDVMPNVDVKAQVQRSKGALMNFGNATPAFYASEGQKANVATVALDFVF